MKAKFVYKGFKPGTIARFTAHCNELRYERDYQYRVIEMVKAGVRDWRLPDAAVILLDGLYRDEGDDIFFV